MLCILLLGLDLALLLKFKSFLEHISLLWGKRLQTGPLAEVESWLMRGFCSPSNWSKFFQTQGPGALSTEILGTANAPTSESPLKPGGRRVQSANLCNWQAVWNVSVSQACNTSEWAWPFAMTWSAQQHLLSALALQAPVRFRSFNWPVLKKGSLPVCIRVPPPSPLPSAGCCRGAVWLPVWPLCYAGGGDTELPWHITAGTAFTGNEWPHQMFS